MEKHDHPGIFIFLLIALGIVATTIGISASCEDIRLENHINAIETRIAGTPTLTPFDALSTQVAELKGGTK